jgi:hypothetical protein
MDTIDIALLVIVIAIFRTHTDRLHHDPEEQDPADYPEGTTHNWPVLALCGLRAMRRRCCRTTNSFGVIKMRDDPSRGGVLSTQHIRKKTRANLAFSLQLLK